MGLMDVVKRNCIIGVPEGEERKKGAESLFKEELRSSQKW